MTALVTESGTAWNRDPPVSDIGAQRLKRLSHRGSKQYSLQLHVCSQLL